MTSFRLKFIEVDSSVEAVTSNDTIKGYMVIRAPKGTTEPMYFDSGNQGLIESMLGVGTAHWSDLNEATAFNAEFGLWISAPPGTSSKYSSYYGGIYITKMGVFPFYQCSDKDNVNFLTEVKIGSESVYAGKGNAEVEVTKLSDTSGTLKKQGQFKITGIPAKIHNNLSYMVLDFWGSAFTSTGAGKIKIVAKDNKLYHLLASGVAADKEIGIVTKDNSTGTYTYTFGTNDSISSSDVGYPYFTFDKLVDYNNLYNSASTSTSEEGTTEEGAAGESTETTSGLSAAYVEALKELIAEGGTKEIGTEAYQSISGIDDRVSWVVSVKNDTYMYLCQKSPTEKVTNITISNIGYDKYKYNLALEYAFNASGEESIVPSNEDDLFAVVGTEGELKPGIYKKIIVEEETEEEVEGEKVTKTSTRVDYQNVTEDYETQYVRLIAPVTGSSTSKEALAFKNTLKIVGSNTSGEMDLLDVGPDEVNDAVPNVDYNTLTFSVTEEVYPGQLTPGGEFTGSLDEEGKDSYGNQIYWPEVLPDDAYSFVEVVPVKTLDDDVDNKGFFTGTRIVDLLGPEVDTVTWSIQGQRYMQYLVDENIRKGLVGNVWQDSMHTVINAGWTEAFLPKYWDAHIFMEPTGDETLKATLASLRKTQKLSTVISFKRLTDAQAANPSKIVVAGRMEGTAQYVNEFLVKDPYTYKKYYFCPIGDIGVNICRIIKERLGGAYPAGVNETGGIGGQLNRAVLKAKYEFDSPKQEVLMNKGLNAVIYDTKLGLIVMGGYTTLSRDNGLSDWCFLAHTLAFDLCRREIAEQVMTPQIFKPIDDYWMTARERTLKEILEKRTTGNRPIWDSAVYDIKKQQTAATKAARNFMIKVRVKVNVFAEYVTLTFENVGQSVVLS